MVLEWSRRHRKGLYWGYLSTRVLGSIPDFSRFRLAKCPGVRGLLAANWRACTELALVRQAQRSMRFAGFVRIGFRYPSVSSQTLRHRVVSDISLYSKGCLPKILVDFVLWT